MGDGFTKLASSIISSSIWSEDDKTRILWITMLALADADGFVSGTIPGLAAMARMKPAQVKTSLEKLAGPDDESRTKEHAGRRIAEAPEGWLILNYAKYRDRDRIERRKAYLRDYQRKYMSAVRHEKSNMCLTSVQPSASASSSASELRGGCKGESESEAEQIYSHYPRKVGKIAALKAINKALALWPASKLLEAVQAYAKAVAAWSRDDREYIPHPSTWFNEGRYDDDRETWVRIDNKAKAASSNIKDLKAVLDARIQRARAMEDRFSFQYPAEQEKHKAEYAEYRKLKQLIAETRGAISMADV